MEKPHQVVVEEAHLLWALGSLCALHRKGFDARLLQREFPVAADTHHDESTLIRTAQALGFRIKAIAVAFQKVRGLPLPLLTQFKSQPNSPGANTSLVLVTTADADRLVYFIPGSPQPITCSL